MLNIRKILLVLLTTFLFQVSFVNAQYVNVCNSGAYGCASEIPSYSGSLGYPSQQATIQVAPNYPELCAVFNRTFGYGESGPDVKRLQVVLGQEGFGYLGATGYFGPATRNAVKIFQSKYRISQTGAVGPITLSRMKSIWCRGSGNFGGGYINTNSNYGQGYYGQVQGGVEDLYIAPVNSSGNNITIAWRSNTSSCNINGTNVPPSGQQIFNVTSETVFTINCNSYGAGTITKSIAVRPNQDIHNIPTVNLSINPTSAIVGTYATIFWNSTNASYCTLNGQNVQTSGSQQILVTNTQVAYQVACFNNSGQNVSSTVYSNPGSGTTTSVASANITASASNVTSSSPVTLNWSSTNTSSCSVTGGPSTYTGVTSSQIVYPTQTTTYTISCVPTNTGANVTNQVTVYVNSGNVNNLSLSIATDKTTYNIGENMLVTITLTNNSSSAVTYSVSSGICGEPKLDGNTFYFGSSVPVTPPVGCSAPQNFTLASGQSTVINSATKLISNYTANNISSVGVRSLTYGLSINGNTLNAQTNFTVNNSSISSITSNITANPTTVSSGQSSTLIWSSTNAGYCGVTGGSLNLTNQATSGSYIVYPTQTTTYSVTCFNANGQSSNVSQVTVNVNGTSAISATITANPTNPAQGQSTTLTWSSTNATYCTITANNSSVFTNQPANGSVVVYPTISTNYQLNCYNNNGQNAASYVYVTTTGNTGTTLTANIYSSLQNIYSGQSVNLNWYSSGANSCALYANGNAILTNQSASGSYLVSPTQSTNYQITCTNTSNGQTASGYVYVTVNGGSTNTQISLVSKSNGYIVVYVPNVCNINGRIDWGDGYTSYLSSSQCNTGSTLSHQYNSTNYSQTYLIRIIDSNNSVLNTLSTTAY